MTDLGDIGAFRLRRRPLRVAARLPAVLAGARFALSLALLAAPLSAVLAAEQRSGPPAQVIESITARFPDATVLRATACRLGRSETQSWGVLLEVAESSEKASHPLRAVIAVTDGHRWKVTEVARRLAGNAGAVRDFLEEYWEPSSGFQGEFEIRCTSPKADRDIGVKANGEFLGAFAARLGRKVMHLCFTADRVYNSWTCSTLDPGTGRIEPSFLQLNAD